MTGKEPFRESLLKVILANPGLHFRELQRRTLSAVGQLEYHLYQLERDAKVVSRRDGRNLRYFSNESGTISERKIAFYMRNRVGRDVIVRGLSEGNRYFRVPGNEKTLSVVGQMVDEGLVDVEVRNGNTFVLLRDRESIIAFLKKYSRSFLDSLASAMFSLIDEP
ncbi:MAG: hypothetical protein M1162_02235 [Candidatus Thermoplasmatota archaeon]|nr:hypothetical protein [Candidatus Thermoplasmatota archaeon]